MPELAPTLAGETFSEELATELRFLRWGLKQPGLPRQVRMAMELRAQSVERREATIPCAHPTDSLRFDGMWPLEMFNPPRAAVTCTACGNSLTVSLRIDVAEQLIAQVAAAELGGGAREVTMPGTIEADHGR